MASTSEDASMYDMFVKSVASAPRVTDSYDKGDGASAINKAQSGLKVSDAILYIAIESRTEHSETTRKKKANLQKCGI